MTLSTDGGYCNILIPSEDIVFVNPAPFSHLTVAKTVLFGDCSKTFFALFKLMSTAVKFCRDVSPGAIPERN
jgi:hypothetical protein